MEFKIDHFKEEQDTSIPTDGVGFTKVPIYRGTKEIKHFFKAVKERGGMICGGYARYCASPRFDPIPPTDIDIYSFDDKSFELLKYYFTIVRELNPKHENDLAITYSRPSVVTNRFSFNFPIQLIKPLKLAKVVTVGNKEEILSNFDFSVIRIALLDEQMALADVDFHEDESSLKLRIKNIHCPISSTLRCMKYNRKGYSIKPFMVLRLFNDWDNRTPEYREKLIKFLTQANEGRGLTQSEIDHLEAMMMID